MERWSLPFLGEGSPLSNSPRPKSWSTGPLSRCGPGTISIMTFKASHLCISVPSLGKLVSPCTWETLVLVSTLVPLLCGRNTHSPEFLDSSGPSVSALVAGTTGVLHCSGLWFGLEVKFTHHKINHFKLGLMAHACDPSCWQRQEDLWKPEISLAYTVSIKIRQGYIARACLKNRTKHQKQPNIFKYTVQCV